ncbi:MAG: response regulator [Candidatus Lokiarchaeota archaeon]|nr:response regulator [Candidatus Lokiarchaeota archaeon]
MNVYKGDVRRIEILLVEDNPPDIDLTREALKEFKMLNNLYVAEDGEEAMNFLGKRGDFKDVPCPDLILLDLNLPKKHGLEVLEEIKNDECLKKIPVVILTTSEAEEDILKTYQLHANCYITKPIDMHQFIKVVKTFGDFWFSIVKLPKLNKE